MSRSLFAELRRRNVFRMAGLYLTVGWLVVEISSTLLPTFGAPDWVIRVLVLLLALGLVPALVFSWIYELTPDGIRRGDEVAPEASIASQTGQRLNRTVIVALALLLGYFVLDKFVLSRLHDAPAPGLAVAGAGSADEAAVPAAAATNSIAVLPLVNDSGDKDQQYFSDGISEDLITALSGFEGLRVIGRNSSFRFRDGSEGSRSIGSKLGVTHLLEGSVRRSGDVVRITITLVNAADGSAMWSQRYDRPYDNLFALQDEITGAVANMLQARLAAPGGAKPQSDRPRSGNLQAYELVLRAKFLEERRTAHDTAQAVGLLERAVELDPGYAYAWARLAGAMSSNWGQFETGTTEQRAGAVAAMRRAADRAKQLDPGLAEAYRISSNIAQSFELDMAAAEADARRALQLAPGDAGVVRHSSTLLGTMGRLSESLDMLERSIAIDPLRAASYHNKGMHLLAMERNADALAAFGKALEIEPGSAITRASMANALSKDGRAPEALQMAAREPDEYWRNWALAIAHHANGDRDQADALRDWMEANHADDGPSQIAELYAQRGQVDEAFRWLEHAHATGDPGLAEIYVTPFSSRLRGDPRFAALVRKMGLPTPAELAALGDTAGRKLD